MSVPISSRGVLRAVVLAASLVAALPALAKVYTFKRTGQDTPITMPDDWSVNPIKSGIEVKSGDGEVYIWVQAVNDGNVGKLMEEYFTYYKKQGVKFSGEKTDSRTEMGGVPVLLMNTPGTFEGEPTIVRFVVAEPKPGLSNGLLIGYWASPKGDAANQGAVLRLLNDLLQP